MTMEQQKTLSERFKKLLSDLKEVLRKISEVFNRLVKHIEVHFTESIKNSYSHTYPQYVYNLRLNTKGFTKPVIRCARSRC